MRSFRSYLLALVLLRPDMVMSQSIPNATREELDSFRPFIEQLFRADLLSPSAPYCATLTGYRTLYAARERIRNDLLPDVFTIWLREQDLKAKSFSDIPPHHGRDQRVASAKARFEYETAWRDLVVRAGLFREISVFPQRTGSDDIRSALVLTRKGYESYGWEWNCLSFARPDSVSIVRAFKEPVQGAYARRLRAPYRFWVDVELLGKPFEWATSHAAAAGLWDSTALRRTARVKVVSDGGSWRIAQRSFEAFFAESMASASRAHTPQIANERKDHHAREKAALGGGIAVLTSATIKQVLLDDSLDPRVQGEHPKLRWEPCHLIPYEYSRRFRGNHHSVFRTSSSSTGRYQIYFPIGRMFAHPDNEFAFINAFEHAKLLAATGLASIEEKSPSDAPPSAVLTLSEVASAAIDRQRNPECISLGTGEIESAWVVPRALPSTESADLPFEVAIRGWVRVDSIRPGLEALREQFPSVRMILDSGYGFEAVLHYVGGVLRVKEWKSLLPTFSVEEKNHPCIKTRGVYCRDEMTGWTR